MWVLILTVSMANSVGGYGSVHIHHVPGFESENVCKVAGKSWLNTRFDGGRQSAVCVSIKANQEEV